VVALPNQGHGFLSLKHAAHWTDVSEKTFNRWIAKGLPVYQAGPGEKILIDPHDIRNFLTRKQTNHSDLDNLVEEMVAELKQK